MGTEKTSLGDRMKGYEFACRATLPRRMPVILRVDGKAFHTFTRRMNRPFDFSFIEAMNLVALELCREAQGAQIAYVQSDEISVLLHNYKRLETDAWFDNQVQKIVSVSSASAAATMSLYYGRPALFDARTFVLPEAEVCNYFIWRQQDATRNSIQMLARSRYSHSECDGKNAAELQEMCFQAGDNWNNLSTHLKRGRFAVRDKENREWLIDNDPPILTQDRAYVERHLAVDSDGKEDGELLGRPVTHRRPLPPGPEGT